MDRNSLKRERIAHELKKLGVEHGEGFLTMSDIVCASMLIPDMPTIAWVSVAPEMLWSRSNNE